MLILQQPNLSMIADSSYTPKKNRGEDAHFFCRKSQVIGVADGVGGWAKHGIDAGEYARLLMRNAADSIKDSKPAAVDPKSAAPATALLALAKNRACKSVLAAAFKKTAAASSSTACIISLAGNRLRAANVGDSGFMVIREGKSVYQSSPQQYSFNFPYQLGLESPGCLEKVAEIAMEVECGDVVVAGTDGLFDNVFPEEVEEMVDRCFNEGMPPGMVARELATAARDKSQERNKVSPFEVAAYEAGVVHFGGKIDDITVVVAYVIPSGLAFGFD